MRLLNWEWWAPKKMEKQLREQGFRDPRYRLLYGSLKENPTLMKEACSTPMNQNHKILPRVNPLLYKIVKENGMHYYSLQTFTLMLFYVPPCLEFTFVGSSISLLVFLFLVFWVLCLSFLLVTSNFLWCFFNNFCYLFFWLLWDHLSYLICLSLFTKENCNVRQQNCKICTFLLDF